MLFYLLHHFSLLFPLFSCITKHLGKLGSNTPQEKSMISLWPHLWSYDDHIPYQPEDSSNDVINDVIATGLHSKQSQ